MAVFDFGLFVFGVVVLMMVHDTYAKPDQPVIWTNGGIEFSHNSNLTVRR